MFQMLQQICPIRATRFQTDFEMGAIQAINQVFPKASVSGCFFHFTQSIWREVNKMFMFVND